MKTEARFLIAVVLMLGVLVGTNWLFPPIVPDATEAPVEAETDEGPAAVEDEPAVPSIPDLGNVVETGGAATTPAGNDSPGTDRANPTPVEQEVVVEGPLYRYTFSSRGARMLSGQLLQFEAINRNGPVEVVTDDSGGYLGQRLVVAGDTVDLSGVPFRVEPEGGFTLRENDSPRALTFVYQHPTSAFRFSVEYLFDPDEYTVGVSGGV